jgi:hypothetical protein
MAEGSSSGSRGLGVRLTHDDVTRLCGDIEERKVAAILATGASLAELEEALAWVAGESDVMGEARLPVAGTVAELYDILVEGEDLWGDEGRSAAG